MNDPPHRSFCTAAAASYLLAVVSVSCGQTSDGAGAAESKSEAATDPTPVATTQAPSPQPPAGGTPTPAAPSPASEAQIAELSKPSGGANGGLYTVQDGTKVDSQTLAGWKTWRALACDRCHGAEQQGLVGPPLVVSLHRLTKDEFKKALTDGRIEKGRSEEHTSELQSLRHLVCRLLL